MVKIINSLVVDEFSISVLDQWCHEPESFQFLKSLMGAYPKQHGRMSLLKIMKARCVGIESSQTSSRLKKKTGPQSIKPRFLLRKSNVHTGVAYNTRQL